MASNVAETLIGAAVLVVAGGFLAYAARTADLSGGGAYELTAQFRKADGVSVGGDVRVSGVKVGSISALELDPTSYKALLRMSIKDGVTIPSDSSAKIASDGLLGGAYVAIDPGGSEYMLEVGEEIEYTQGSVSILDLVGKAIHSATD